MPVSAILPACDEQTETKAQQTQNNSGQFVLFQVSQNANVSERSQSISIVYKITDILRARSLVDRYVYMGVCKYGCDVLDSGEFLRNIL